MPYDWLSDDMVDGHMVVQWTSPSATSFKEGLIDSQGHLVIPMDYISLGTPSEGLIPFKRKENWGYMDYRGKVVIPEKFIFAYSFGKKGALASSRYGSPNDEEYSYRYKYGLIDRTGAWLVQPTYDEASDAGSVMHEYVRGYNAVYKRVEGLIYTAGIFDLDHGHELIAPTYANVGVITPERFQFSKNYSELSPVGLMDATGKVLAPPDQYVNFKLDPSSHYLIARIANDTPALLDLDGHTLIPPQWNELDINENFGAIFAYTVQGEGDDKTRRLGAVYDLHGKPIFIIKNTDCGAEQLVDGNGKVIWPQDVKPYCDKGGKNDS